MKMWDITFINPANPVKSGIFLSFQPQMLNGSFGDHIHVAPIINNDIQSPTVMFHANVKNIGEQPLGISLEVLS
jgi:hypothetical protein